MPVDHEFGDQHTELKLSIVEKYLKFFTTALRGKFEELWYIDAFAGTGSRTVKYEERAAGLLDAGEPERIERRRGSARIAIDVKPPFDFIVFIDSKPSYVSALHELAANYPNRRIAVVQNDANDALKSLIAANNWRSTRAVLFLDPYGMQLEWSTLEKVAATRAIDVWFLFSLAGLYRQATRQLADLTNRIALAGTRPSPRRARLRRIWVKQNGRPAQPRASRTWRRTLGARAGSEPAPGRSASPRGRGSAGDFLPPRRHLQTALGEGPDDHGQQHLQRLAVRRRLAR